MADRTQLLEEIQQVGFQVDDLTLYLDTHPLDRDALDAFTQAKPALPAYAELCPGI